MFKSISILLMALTLSACGVSEKGLISAAYNGDTDTVTKALDAGMDVNTRDQKGRIPLLSYAAGGGHANVAEMLLQRGADINGVDAQGWTALHHTVANGAVDVIDVLAKHGADLNLKNSDEWTPLMYAVFQNKPNVVKKLLSHGADRSIKTSQGIDALAIAQQKGLIDIASALRSTDNRQSG